MSPTEAERARDLSAFLEQIHQDNASVPQKPVVVQKYGGSSVADPERLKQVARRISQTVKSGHRVVVVVSAMGKTTDQLISLAKSITQNPPRRELDMLMSSGERISMALLAMALHDLGHDAISFTGSQSGILTNDRHTGARIIEIRPVRIQDELERDRVVIVAGFQGVSYKREVTTLGRGGSDTTAVALAAALCADCEIYSDVDGVYSADPRVVPDAKHLPEVSATEMQELSDHGAKVLNAQAVEWAQRAGIVIHARRTDGSEKSTRILPSAKGTRTDTAAFPKATAVSSMARLVTLRSTHPADLLRALSEQGVALRQTSVSQDSIEVSFTLEDLPDFSRTLSALKHADPELFVKDTEGLVTVVGPGVGSDPGLLSQTLCFLREAGLHPGALTTSPLRVSIALPSPEVETATRLLHRLLC
ncbi:MAG TPA: aspartate kinase [Pseudomonadota bacterium]|jgi:aspartate kinase|nr:aspartate kinase [Pseudomonadota bacterium]